MYKLDVAKYYSQVFDKYPQVFELETKYYEYFPEYTREMGYRVFTPEEEYWVRHDILPMKVEILKKQVNEMVKVLEKRHGKGKFCMEVHVSTCMKLGGDVKQVELFVDFDRKVSDRYTALAESLPEAEAVSVLFGYKNLLAYSGNKSWHVIIPAYMIGMKEIDADTLDAVAKILEVLKVQTVRKEGSSVNTYKFTLADLDAQALGLCHMRRMLLSLNCKGSVELPIKGGIQGVLQKGIKHYIELAEKVKKVLST